MELESLKIDSIWAQKAQDGTIGNTQSLISSLKWTSHVFSPKLPRTDQIPVKWIPCHESQRLFGSNLRRHPWLVPSRVIVMTIFSTKTLKIPQIIGPKPTPKAQVTQKTSLSQSESDTFSEKNKPVLCHTDSQKNPGSNN